MTSQFRNSLVALCVLALTMSGCATAYKTTALEAPNLADRVIIGRDTVLAQAYATVLDLLQARVPRFHYSADGLGREPIVLLDGVQLADGIKGLSMLRTAATERIDILWPGEAMNRYGSRGAQGAIVISTRIPGRTN